MITSILTLCVVMASDKQQDYSTMESYSYSRKRLYFSAIAASTIFVAVGMFMGWSSPALVLLQDRNFTESQYTLLASIPGLAPGPLITMFGIDLIGRKFTLLVIWLTLMICYIMMLISEDIYVLLIARFIGGWGMGATFSAIGIYISEISDVQSRSPLNSMSMILFTLGSIVICSVGPFTSVTVMSIVSLAVTLMFGIFFWYLPESPYHYINKGNTAKARETLVWLRKNMQKENVENELKEIQFNIEEEKKQKVGIRKLFTSKVVWKQFGMAWYILALQQLCGLGPVSAYAQQIFEAANLPFGAAYVPIALYTIGLFLGAPTPFLVKKFGNKIIFIVCSIGVAASLAMLGVYFLLLERGHDVSAINWLPLVIMLIYFFFFYTGFGGLIWSLISDMFAPSVKGYATGISGIISTFLGFVVTQAFGVAIYHIKFGATFLGWSFVFLISSTGVIFLPKLTHMSLQEIQDYFEGKK